MIQLADACLAYDGDCVLRDVNLSIEKGELVSLLGPSGCGKSTMLRMIAGLMPPTSGQVQVGERTAMDHRKSVGKLSFVFQDPRLLPWRDVLQNIGLPLELLGKPIRQRRDLALQAMKLVGLEDRDAHKRPQMLSGGMRMRVSIARALVTNPEVLVLDEPFAALDDLLREQLNLKLLQIWRDRCPTTVFVTHNISEAVFLSQRVVVMGNDAENAPSIRHVFAISPTQERDHRWKRTGEFAELVGVVGDAMRGQV